ncbi:S-layer homology domain-containing protein [Anaerotignum lactatifermentans]|uniref:S-layer homology domain-containing protein n=1 Tax=Anaerotignum lactatifermentans TaxID=160404 RepID=UPI00255C8CD4|nr:S-layer homology domain-containing protein [Anaerotignum lactatifermentans]
MKRKVLPCFMALSMTLTAVPNVAMAEEKQLQETEKTSIVENEALETESLEALVGESSTMLNGGAANGVVPYDANVAKVGDNYYTTLEDAIDNASSGDTVELLSSVEVANTLNIDTGIVLQGSEDAYITFTGASRKTLFDVTTNEQVTLKNVYGEAVNGRIMVLNASSPHVTFENCEFYAKERGISFTQNGIAKNASLILDGTKIFCTQNVPKDGDFSKEAAIGDFRGISVFDVKNSEIILRNNSELSGFGYSINVAGTNGGSAIVDNSGLVITIEDSLIRGWTSLNVWGSFAKYNIIDSYILGINNSTGESNSFSAITFNGDIYDQFDGMHAYNNELYIKDSTITNYQKEGTLTPSGKIVLEELLRIDNGITKLTFGGDVNFIDTTNNLKQALDLSSMKEEGRVEFLRKNIVYEDDANVTCQSEKGLILYEAYVEGDDTFYLVDDMTVSEDIIIPKDTVIDAGQYKMILTAGYSITAYQDLSGIIQVPAGYRLAVSGNETDGFTYTAEKKSSGGSHRYDGYITVINPKNGTVSVSDDWADEDQKITLTITPDKGYVVDKIEIVDLEGDKIDAKKVEDEDNEYTFRMANCDVTVTVTFKEEGKTEDKEETNETEETDKTEETTTPETVAFSDVSESDWFYKGVSYVVENGMMNGVGENQFAPNAPLTREMLAVVLYNMEKQPESTGVNPFADVKADMWYTDAIVWANANGIVAGYDDSTFGLGDSITREQLAAILYRYAQMKGYDVTEKADLTGYADSAAISGYAVEAMQWANANGIVNGMTATTLAPQGTATRAQVATMLMNFCENVVTKAE